MTNEKREAMLECMVAMEVAMEDIQAKIQNRRDILENNIIFWLCRSVWLLLEQTIRDSNRNYIGDDAFERRNNITK